MVDVRVSSAFLLGVVCCGGSAGTYTQGGADISAEPGRSYRYAFDSSGSSPPPELIPILGDWSTAADATAPSAPNVIRQTGAFPGSDFPRVVVRDLAFEGQRISVRCRPESGSTDQACGVMFRFVDSDNYYLTRANALEGNVRLYRVVAGSREQLASVEASVAANTWHLYEVEAHGPAIAVRWDGVTAIDFSDVTFARGKVGLWTKADSVTAFDDLEVVAD